MDAKLTKIEARGAAPRTVLHALSTHSPHTQEIGGRHEAEP
jgi:hypothetical protein